MAFKFQAVPSISVLSTRYLRCSVAATDSGSPVDPTGSAVSFAFIVGDAYPTDSDWVSGTWETAGDEYFARCLVGSGGSVTLVAGVYTVWVKLVLSPETLVESVGEVNIY